MMTEKRAAILTYHHADNLGAVLQAYALQQTLKQLGVSPSILDYRCDEVEKTRHVQPGGGWKGMAKRIPMTLYYKLKSRGFSRFRRENLALSPKYLPGELEQCAKDYDLFITGSDQVFNLECSGWDYSYFLDFLPEGAKKYSYAASIGNAVYSPEERVRVKEALSSFSGVSVRENSGARQLAQLGVEARVHPDPVLLLSREEWLSLAAPRLCKKDYVFVYRIQPDVHVDAAAQAYARKHGKKVIYNKKSPEFILHSSPAEFLSWILYADCVFTNSFHGTAFSLLLGKPLAADIVLKNGGVNNRVKELLESCGCENCVLDPNCAEPELPEASEAIGGMKQTAISYLRSCCEGFAQNEGVL